MVTIDFHQFVSTYAFINRARFRKGKQNHRVHSDFSDEYVRKYFQTLFHK